MGVLRMISPKPSATIRTVRMRDTVIRAMSIPRTLAMSSVRAEMRSVRPIPGPRKPRFEATISHRNW